MLHPNDQIYYLRRAAEEMDRADQAINASVAAIHYELANRYSMLAAQSGTQAPRLMLVSGGENQRAA